MALDTQSNALNEIYPSFRPFIQNLWKISDFGLRRSKIDIGLIKSSIDELGDEFTLLIPYAGNMLHWEILFDCCAPWSAPDFRFDDEGFLADADDHYLEEHLPSLANWEDTNPKALSNLLSELVVLYRQHQVSLLNDDENSRACFEYSALLGDAITCEQDIEVWVGPDNVQFLIRLKIDTEELPTLFNNDLYQNPGGECALLLVRYPNAAGPELILSPLVLRVVGNINLPLMYESGVLMDYVPIVTSIVNQKITSALSNDKLKRGLLSQLLVKYEGAILEHDNSNASFLFQINNFYWILLIDIGENFPERPPILTLRSVYHLRGGKPRTKVLASCPYSNVESYLREQVQIFKQECVGPEPSHS